MMKDIFVFLFIFFLGNKLQPISSLILNCSFDPIAPTEYIGLFKLFNQTNGEHWNWRNESFGLRWNFSQTPFDPSTNDLLQPCGGPWQGLNCQKNNQLCAIYSINLKDYNLFGRIPSSIELLSNLRTLTLDANYLHHNIPDTIGNLSNLEHLSLGDNFIGSFLPDSLFNLTSLRVLDLDYNLLTGTIPLLFKQLSELTYLSLSRNIFTFTLPEIFHEMYKLEIFTIDQNGLYGALPETLSQLLNLRYLNLEQNSFYGEIPATFGELKRVIVLDIADNFFHGDIPTSLGDMSALQSLYANFNHLNGRIPLSFAKLSQIEILDLNRNELYGPIPSELGSITSLRFFMLHNNHCNSSLPSELGLLTNMLNLNLGSNFFVGSIPSTLGNLTNLISLDLDNNLLRGSIPTSLCKMSSLKQLQLNGNYLDGSLPSEIGFLKNLSRFVIQLNHLTGPLPTSIGNMSSLFIFSTSSNYINGTIPSQLMLLPNLTTFEMGSNFLSGTLPSFLCNISSLVTLSLSFNSFSGSIPSLLAFSPSLKYFECISCNLTGTIPSEFGMAYFLEQFVISQNRLTGSIPSSLGGLPFLQNLDLIKNRLTHTIPTSLGLLSSLNFLELNNNFITGPIPSQLGNATKLISLYLYNNRLTQSIPPELGDLRQLLFLSLYINSLSGSIPDSLTNSSNLVNFFAYSNHLTGELPSRFGHMVSMRNLDLSYNLLHGQLPSSFSYMRLLTLVYLSSNFLSGPVPQFYSLNDFTVLNLEENLLTGTIPTSFGSLTSLQVLGLAQNLLSGTIPSQLGPMSSMVEIVLFGNSLTGTIPPELGISSTIQLLDFHSNILSGPVPSNLCNISSLQQLILLNNSLTTTIPPCLLCMPQIHGLSLSSNCFTGSLPFCVNCQSSPSLSVLDLSDLSSGTACRVYPFTRIINSGFYPHNFIHNGIPSCIWGWPNLTTLYLDGNGINGPINLDYLNSSSLLVNVSLAYNQLTGTIPPALQTYGRFQWLDLSHNRLSGMLSEDLTIMDLQDSDTNSRTFSIATNRLSGPLPPNYNVTSQPDLISNMLQGNMFSFDSTSLPTNTLNRDQVTAFNASYPLDAAMVLSAIFVCLHLILILTFYRIGYSAPSDSSLSQLFHNLKAWRQKGIGFMKGNQEEGAPRLLRELLQSLFQISMFFFHYGWLSIVFVGFTVLVIKVHPQLRSLYTTQTFQYQWLISTCFLHGGHIFLLICYILAQMVILALWNQSKLDRVSRTRTESVQGILKFFRIGGKILITKLRSIFDLKFSWRPSMNGVAWVTLLTFVLMIDVLVMLLANIFYLQLVVSDQNVSVLVLQFLLALFKSIWNSFYIPFTLRALNFLPRIGIGSTQIPMSQLVFTGWAINTFNNLLAPCIATALSDSSCLLPLFEQEALPTASFSIFLCGSTITTNTTSFCRSKQLVIFSVGSSLNPPFIYTYDCASALIVQYVPVFLYNISITGLLQPLLLLLVMNFGDFLPSFSLRFLYIVFPILKWGPNSFILDSSPNQPLDIDYNELKQSLLNEAENRACFLSGMILNKVLMYITMFLSFGLASPYLGFIIIFSSVLDVQVWLITIGRFREIIEEAKCSSLYRPPLLDTPSLDIDRNSLAMSDLGLTRLTYQSESHRPHSLYRNSFRNSHFGGNPILTSLLTHPASTQQQHHHDTRLISIMSSHTVDLMIQIEPTKSSNPSSSSSSSSSYSPTSPIANIIRWCIWASLWVCCLFWSIQIFDSVGDVMGVSQATLSVILFFCLETPAVWLSEVFTETIFHTFW